MKPDADTFNTQLQAFHLEAGGAMEVVWVDVFSDGVRGGIKAMKFKNRNQKPKQKNRPPHDKEAGL
jgi:hypothetical protein